MSVPKTDERAGATPASIVPTARSGSTGKIVSARADVRLTRTGDMVALGGFFYTGLFQSEQVRRRTGWPCARRTAGVPAPASRSSSPHLASRATPGTWI